MICRNEFRFMPCYHLLFGTGAAVSPSGLAMGIAKWPVADATGQDISPSGLSDSVPLRAVRPCVASQWAIPR